MKRIEDIKEFKDIDTYYEISSMVEEIFEDRVEAHKHLVTANKEIERLNNIINELEKELKEDYKIWMCNSRSNGRSVQFGIDVCKTHFYNRLQELKGDSSNE